MLTATKRPKVIPAINELELKKFSKEIGLDAAFVIFQVKKKKKIY